MMEKLAAEGVSLVVSAGDQVEDQSWGKSSEYEAFFCSGGDGVYRIRSGGGKP